MRDPHVERLHYTLSSGKDISYENPPPVVFSNAVGAFDLRDGHLTVSPCAHFPDEEEARRAVDAFLRGWEVEADLRLNVGMVRFKFERADLVDRDPPPPGTPQVFQVRGVVSAIAMANCVTVHLTCAKYPDPPPAFSINPDVESGYGRWRAYRDGKEPLPSMAYFILTLLQARAGSRSQAARLFAIDPDVLKTFGRLSSTKGSSSTARKANASGTQDLSGSEHQWLEQAVRLLIRRLGGQAAGGSLTPIRMSDLPKL